MIFSFRMATARKFTRSAVDADASKFGLWLCNSIHPSIVDISSWTRDVLHRGWRFHVARAPRYPVAFENSCPRWKYAVRRNLDDAMESLVCEMPNFGREDPWNWFAPIGVVSTVYPRSNGFNVCAYVSTLQLSHLIRRNWTKELGVSTR